MAEEKKFENKVKAFLKEQGCWYLKTWSSGFQRAGVPDLIVCCNGHFIGVEVKATNGRLSDLQKYELKSIRMSGGKAIALYPDSFEEFKEYIHEILQQKGTQEKASRQKESDQGSFRMGRTESKAQRSK